MTSILAGWDSETDDSVDGQVGSGPKSGPGGRVTGSKSGGPGLYMIEPSGLYWVGLAKEFLLPKTSVHYRADLGYYRVITAQLLERADRQQRRNWRS